MCGISGVIAFNSRNLSLESLLLKMCNQIFHRGPDEAGYYIKDNVALGMRRLKIIDLTTGSQPIYNEDRSIVTVFNGEIYNFSKLRFFLKSKGHTFYTKTDTEVIVHLYEEFGENFLKYLNGMFAIALWDINNKTLILARDRFGEKPLYYSLTNDFLMFASEIKSILSTNLIKKEIDYEALYHYFSLLCIPEPYSIFKNIKKLPHAHYLKFKDGKIKIIKYWNLEYKPDFTKKEDDFCVELKELITASLEDRIISDVPLGAFLSGGIDSSIVVGLMSEIMDQPVKTFSIGFKEDKYNELNYARLIANKFKTEHHEIILEPNATDMLDNLLYFFDEPFAGPSAIPTYYVSKLAKKYVTVVLTGDGGDELFAGYDSYKERIHRKYINYVPKWLKSSLSFFGNLLPENKYIKGKGFLQSLSINEAKLHFLGLTENIKKNIFSPDFLKFISVKDTFDLAKSYLNPDLQYLTQFQHLDSMLYLPNNVLVKVDRMSMANSLETRALFLDHEIAEYVATIPAELKFKNNISKYILKKSFKDILPQAILERSKWGFALPVDIWLRNELKDLMFSVLSEIKKYNIFNDKYWIKIYRLHLNKSKNYNRLLWSLLVFHYWYNLYFN